MMATPAGTLGDASKGLGRQLYIALAPTYPVQGRSSLAGKGGPHCGRNSHVGSTTPSTNYYATAVQQGTDTAAAGPLGGQVVSTVCFESRGLSVTTTNDDHLGTGTRRDNWHPLTGPLRKVGPLLYCTPKHRYKQGTIAK